MPPLAHTPEDQALVDRIVAAGGKAPNFTQASEPYQWRWWEFHAGEYLLHSEQADLHREYAQNQLRLCDRASRVPAEDGR